MLRNTLGSGLAALTFFASRATFAADAPEPVEAPAPAEQTAPAPVTPPNAPASAESPEAPTPPTPADPWTRPIALLAIAGASPAGMIGLGIDLSPSRTFAAEVAAGVSAYGLARFSFTPRVRVSVSKRVSFGFGGGLAFGGVREASSPSICIFDCPGTYRKDWSSGILANGLLDVEGRRASGGFVWRVFGGAGALLNPDDYTCTGSLRCPKEAPVLAYVGAALGYAPP